MSFTLVLDVKWQHTSIDQFEAFEVSPFFLKTCRGLGHFSKLCISPHIHRENLNFTKRSGSNKIVIETLITGLAQTGMNA